MITIRKNILTGYTVRARRVSGKQWLVYQLSDPERGDRVGNRSPIQYAVNRRDAYRMVKDLDDYPEEGLKNGSNKI